MRKYKINFVADGIKLFSFSEKDSVDDIFKVLDQIDDKYLKKVKLEIESSENKEESSEVKEAFEKAGGPFWYFTKHGVQPGSVPKDIQILDVKDTPNGSYFLSDKVLTTKELYDYEIVEKSPEEVSESLKGFVKTYCDNCGKTNRVEVEFEDFNKPFKDTTYTCKYCGTENALTDHHEYDEDGTIKEKEISEKYEENADGTYTIWSASDLAKDGYQIPLVTIKRDDEGKFYAEALSDSNFDTESKDLAQSVIDTAYKSGKDDNYILTRIDKTLNHNDPYFSVEFNRGGKGGKVDIASTELLAAQTLRSMRDELKNFVNSHRTCTEEDIVAKFAELTGVDYYTEKVIDGNITINLPDTTEEYVDSKTGKTKYRDIYKKHTFSGKEQYDHLLKLMGKDPNDRFNYETPSENPFIQRLKDLTEDLIEKQLLKQNPNFYK